MEEYKWYKGFPGAIMVSSKDGIITAMNDQCAENYASDGGYDLLGENAVECHKGISLEKVKRLYENKELNVYTIQKNGRKKFIYQSPYYEDGEFAGFVEMSLPIPDDIPHYNRDKK